MAPTVQPPPLQNGATEPATTTSLVDTIHSLHDLILGIALPKTDKAKNFAIAVVDFQLACSLITSACASLQAHHENLQLNDISKKLDVITAHFDIAGVAQPSQPHSYASVLATGIKSSVKPKAHPGLRFDIMLAQADCTHPVLADLSNDDLSEKIDGALMDSGCFFEVKPCTLDHDRDEGVEYVTPRIRAIGQHRSGDIWLVAYSEAKRDFLVETASRWVPQLSVQLDRKSVV